MNEWSEGAAKTGRRGKGGDEMREVGIVSKISPAPCGPLHPTEIFSPVHTTPPSNITTTTTLSVPNQAYITRLGF